jgi:hypothetical protein
MVSEALSTGQERTTYAKKSPPFEGTPPKKRLIHAKEQPHCDAMLPCVCSASPWPPSEEEGES